MADGDYYSAKVDIFNVYGEKNAIIWADADNSRNDRDLIESRFEWANLMSKTQIDARLCRGPYDVPFTLPCPTMITLISATLAGLMLYDTRRIAADQNPSRVIYQRRQVTEWINQIMSGRLKLLDSTGVELALQSENTPKVLEDTEEEEETVLDLFT